jgi:signal transduction histidine kinase
MILTADQGAILHAWGQTQGQPASACEVSMSCTAPFQRWTLGYAPGSGEFPSAALFPILLGVTSGSLLVPSLAWLYFRESSREIRVAHQRVSFVNQVSHELKTPLTNIRLYAEMARARAEDRNDADSVRQLAVVESETARLSRLIQNVLNFARKQRDRLTVLTKPVDLAEVIERVAEHWRPILEKRGFRMEVDVPQAMPMRTDADAVEQIVGNLLSNAEKYAADGQVVRLQTRMDEAGVTVAVEDAGPGIPASKQELVFEPFERLRSDLREGVSGTGIGLTISRELAELLGGRLSVDPTYRQGARFVLTLPRQAPAV